METNQTIETILQQLLEEYEANPTKNVDELLAEKLKSMGATDECLAEVQETSKAVDAFAEKAKSLKEARDAGKTRRKWIMEQLENSLDGFEDETKVAALNALDEAIENKENEVLNQ